MLQKRLFNILSLFIILMMGLSACAPSATPVAPTEAPAATDEPTAAADVPTSTAAPEPTATVAASTRKGGWLDQVVFSVVDKSSAVTQLGAGAIDIYAGGLAAADFPTITKAGLSYAESSGLQYSIMYNPAVFTDKTMLNPFSDKKIREATNYLYNRDYINQEVYAGANLQKFFSITTQFPAYANTADVAAGLEAQYAFNPDKAKQIIADEMKVLGATTDAAGKFQFNGKPVSLNFLIRTDSDGTRKPIGDYVAKQLDSVGFTVISLYKKSSEASPIWQGDPTTGAWNLYTAAYSATAIDREEKINFQEYYAPSSIQGTQPFLSNTDIDPVFAKLCDDLTNGNYATLAERDEMMAKALPLSMQDSLMVFLIDGKNFVPYTKNVQVSYDLAAGVEGAYVAPYTLRFADKEGGSLKWGAPDLFTDPWNPIAGSNWAWDQANHNFTDMGFQGLMPDPYTGLEWPIAFDKATVTVTKGLPIGKTLDWVTLNTVDSVAIPQDAFVDWDAKTQKFVTVADAAAAKTLVDQFVTDITTSAGTASFAKFDAAALGKFLTDAGAQYAKITSATIDVATALKDKDTQTSLSDEATKISGITVAADQQKELISFTKDFIGNMDAGNTYELGSKDFSTSKIMSAVTYPADLFEKVKWHDGTKLSVADFVMGLIMTFDRAKKGSSIYDAQAVPNFQSFMQGFKGFRIVSTSPLSVEYYADVYSADAELDVTTMWPWFQYGEGSWHMLAVSNLAEAGGPLGQLAYSNDKATAAKVEWTNYVGGPSLDILSKYVDKAIADKYVPYAPTLGQYITADDAVAAYTNLKTWYAAHGNFWVGTGPYILDKASPTEKTATMSYNPDFPYPADAWSKFSSPKVAVVTVDGPAQLTIGKEGTFNIGVTYNNAPYASAEIKQVKYLLFDATNTIVGTGVATLVSDGSYTVTLDSAATSKLTAGSDKLVVIVVALPVAIPTFFTQQFVTVAP